MTWKIGDKAKWLGGSVGWPSGASWNPPPPGWKLPTKEEQDAIDHMCSNMHVEVMAVDENGHATRARAADGFEFNPAIDPDLLVPASHAGWEHPNERRRPVVVRGLR